MLLYLIVVSGSYLLGSIPFGFLLVWLVRKEDIRTTGSGNIGATNVLRSGAKKLGVLTFVLDGAKGYAAVMVAELLARGKDPAILRNLAITAGLFVILGHMFPVWLHFKGGKGVATAFGVFVALCSGGALRAGAMGGCRGPHPVCFPGFHSGRGGASVPYSVAIAGQIRLRIRSSDVCLLLDCHREARANIVRLLQGTEHRF